MMPTVWEIIFLSITVVPALMLLTNTMNGEIDIRKVAWNIAFIFALSLIYGMIQQIAWGTVLTMFFPIVSISFSVLCVIKKRLDRHVDVGDLGVAVGKLHGIETALCRSHQIPSAEQCRIWLESVCDLQRRAQDIKVGYDRSGLNYSNRVDFSRRARQELKIANDLLRQGDNILHPKDQLRGTTNFYKKLVIDFIKDMADDSGLLGIWGTGGVGKTSLLKLLVGDSRSEYDNGSFQTLFVPAARTGSTVGQVQEAIATSLGLSLECSETSQAKIIHDHLKDMSFLLLIDDLWGYVDLNAVGIPLPLGRVLVSLQGSLERKARRKIVLTTRNMDLCDKMGCSRDKTIQMECFDEEDARDLFHRGWPDSRAYFLDETPIVLPARASSSSSHRRRQLVTRQPYSIGDVQLQRTQDNNQMSSYQKMCKFIEDKDANSRLLGVWGMRGVGKTNLLRIVRNYYQSKACFNHIVLVGAGTGHIVNKVQHAIAINLGLDLAMMSSMDELSRAMYIFHYLEHKSFLLLLDDIREPLNWWAIGLPLLLHRQQKIILATRSRAACALMGCETVDTIEMHCLGGDDAWYLFSDKAGLGLIDDHPQVHHLAKQMVSMCGGLPLALCSLGRAMSDKRDLREWRSAYSQLSAIGLEACEIDEKVGALILNPAHGWRQDTILPADEQIQARTTIVHGQKQETAISLDDAVKIFDQSNRPRRRSLQPHGPAVQQMP